MYSTHHRLAFRPVTLRPIDHSNANGTVKETGKTIEKQKEKDSKQEPRSIFLPRIRREKPRGESSTVDGTERAVSVPAEANGQGVERLSEAPILEQPETGPSILPPPSNQDRTDDAPIQPGKVEADDMEAEAVTRDPPEQPEAGPSESPEEPAQSRKPRRRKQLLMATPDTPLQDIQPSPAPSDSNLLFDPPEPPKKRGGRRKAFRSVNELGARAKPLPLLVPSGPILVTTSSAPPKKRERPKKETKKEKENILISEPSQLDELDLSSIPDRTRSKVWSAFKRLKC